MRITSSRPAWVGGKFRVSLESLLCPYYKIKSEGREGWCRGGAQGQSAWLAMESRSAFPEND